MGTSTPWTEVRVRSRLPVATRRTLLAYSVNLLILHYVWSALLVDFSAANSERLDVMYLEPPL